MNITKHELDDLNAVLTVSIEEDDYKDRVDNTLQTYRKRANIPGFRKGQVPMNLIKKQYEKAVKLEEINKLLQNSVGQYIHEQKLQILGQPLPRENESLDLAAATFQFEFELGLSPTIQIDFDRLNTIIQYEIIIDPNEVDQYIERLRDHHGETETLNEIGQEAIVNATLEELNTDDTSTIREDGLSTTTDLQMDDLSSQTQAQLMGGKVGDTFDIVAMDLFAEIDTLSATFNKTREEVEAAIHTTFRLTVKTISRIQMAALDQALFDKVYGPNVLDSEQAFREKVEAEFSTMFAQETDQHWMDLVVKSLVDETSFNLPKDFLMRWLNFSNDKIASIEQAQQEYDKSEEALRYQLIETRLAEQFELNITPEELEEEAARLIRMQFAQFGKSDMSAEEIAPFIQNILQSKEEYNRLSDRLFHQKMLALYKEKITPKIEKVTRDEFIELLKDPKS